jgi:uracil-DNA glycosylase
MLIGEGPGVEEERQGQPFVGKSGRALARILEMLGLDEYYLTNIVTCRSCVQQFDQATGVPMLRTNRRTQVSEFVYKDEPPTPPQYNACRQRLYEEIYLVDPVVIVGLGGKACEALMGRPVTITRDRGESTYISVPGRSYAPVLTEKQQQWLHRGKDKVLRTENEQNQVRYYFLPTLHPAYVLRKLADMGPDSPFRQLVSDLKKAVRTHEVYQELVYGRVPASRQVDEENETSSLHAQMRAEEEPEE